jgi:membrane protease YdiL (CAAX protease family)
MYWLAAMALAIGFVYAYNRKVKKSGSVNWTPLEAISITLATYFGGQLIGSLMVYLPLAIAGWDSQKATDWFDSSTFGQFVLILAIEAITVGLIYLFIKRRGASFKTLGLRKPQFTDLGYALLGFAAYFLLYVGVAIAAKNLLPGLDVDQEQQIGFESATGAQLGLVFVSLVLLPPVVEEILMRGFLYGGLKKSLPKVWAVVITSGLFAVAHLQFGSGEPLLWIAAIDTFVLSLVLIYLRDKTNGLWAPIGLHMIKNFVAFMALFVLTK